MDDCEDCGRALCRDCNTHYCIEQCPCGRSHTCDCACAEYLEGLASAVDATAAVTSPSEKEAAATLARDCTDHAAVLLQRLCGYTKRHPSHTFMRLEVLFQCPGEHGTEGEL